MPPQTYLLQRSLPKVERIVEHRFTSLSKEDRKDLIQGACLAYLEADPLHLPQIEEQLVAWLLKIYKRRAWKQTHTKQWHTVDLRVVDRTLHSECEQELADHITIEYLHSFFQKANRYYCSDICRDTIFLKFP